MVAQVEIAKFAGFCYGVKNAVEMTRSVLEKNENVYSTNHIVHNDVINDEFKNKGLVFVKEIKDVPEGSTIILRAHGVGKSEIELCEKRKLNMINTTCKNVSKIHEIVKERSKEGYKILIVGDKNHAEMNGIIGWIEGEYEVLSDVSEIKEYDKVCLVSQTTTNVDLWNQMKELIKESSKECITYDTICMATYNRQKEAKELAARVETFIVIGDKKSANSNRLYEISKEFCENTLFIQTENDFEIQDIKGEKVGITAGASTPDSVIEAVVKKIENN